MHYQAIIYSINTITTGSLYLLMPISITTCVLTCTSSIYIVHHDQSSIIVTSICFRNISENFPNIYKEKNLNGLRYLLQKKYSEVSFERLFFCEILQSAATKISNAVQGKACSSMYMDGWYNTRISCHVRENKQHLFFFMPFEVFIGP